tara:strand:- start:17 stop:196 length:180 start_codon:yes stop_codon:yes gene_type:complete
MILWLASYPKSGNTWVRALLANYFSDNSKKIFKDIKKIGSFPNQKDFENIVNIDFIKKK